MRLTLKKNLGDTFFPVRLLSSIRSKFLSDRMTLCWFDSSIVQLEHHDHVERLFETYFHTIDEIQNEGQQLAANIKSVNEEQLSSCHAVFTDSRVLF